MADWEPDATGLREICQLLELSQLANTKTHSQVYQRLEQYSQLHDFNNYLVFIFVHMSDVSDNVRAGAGLTLKKNVMSNYEELPPGVRYYIQNEVVKCIGDQSSLIRATVGVIVTTIVTQVHVDGWPGLIEGLSGLLDSPDPLQLQGSLSVLRKLSEDVTVEIAKLSGGQAIDYLVPKLLSFFRCPDDKVRVHALASLNQFILLRTPALTTTHAEELVQGLYDMAMDDHLPVRRLVCEAMVLMMQVRADLFVEKMHLVVDYMLLCSASSDEALALEACEFWSTFAESSVVKQLITPFLPQLIPVLLKNMMYTEFSLMMLNAEEEEDTHIPDRPQDVAPRGHRSKQVGSSLEESDDEEGGDGASGGDWSLRKSAAASIDILAGVYKAELLPHLIPCVSAAMNSTIWTEREAAVLALGAIADGCTEAMSDELPGLLNYLLTNSLSEPKFLLRKITCWTLGRYAGWVVQQNDPANYLGPYTHAILSRIVDRNKQVQEAACSAIATLEEKAQTDLILFLPQILSTFAEAFTVYQTRSLRTLYDAIGTLAEMLGKELAKPELVQIILPPLMMKWHTIDLEDYSLFPLMEALTSVAAAVGVLFAEQAPAIFERCALLINGTLEAYANEDQQIVPEKDYMVCALDLLSGVVEGVGPGVESLVVAHNILPMLEVTVRDEMPVRQSSFALVGDLVKECIGNVRPYLHSFIPALGESLDPQYVSACNNACWALGEIAMQVGAEIEPYVSPLMERLIYVLNRPLTNRNLLENAAITIGRLGLKCPQSVAPHLTEFVHNWCLNLRNIRDDAEKASAFRGLCAMIEVNPKGIVDRFILVCDAIASWRAPPPDLQHMFNLILQGFKSSLDQASWEQYYGSYPPKLRQLLNAQYGLGP